MKVSYNWLKTYLDIPAEGIADILTDTGLEVSGTEQLGMHPDIKDKLIVGKVLSVDPHPNADRLQLTRVDVGKEEPLQIVCGAPNVAAGQKVAVAPVGTTLHHINGSTLQIKKARIRGEESEGMICAEDEIGISDKHKGIIVLEKNAETGTAAATYLNTTADTVFEIDLTPNRIDGASHIGVARDIRAYLTVNSNGKVPELCIPSVAAFNPGSAGGIDVSVEAEDACLRYTGILLTEVQIQPSPLWLQQRINAIGLKPVNNVVDITNFVLYETGQPLHAFDASRITGGKVVVKKLKNKTPFVMLDGRTIALSSEDLMICNQSEGMCLAGVYGGKDSGVTEATTEVFLESACFDPTHIRKTARRHGLSTDASFRFERGVDPNGTVYALKRAALLIAEICGGQISSGICDEYPETVDRKILDFSFEYCNRLTGQRIDRRKIKDILNALDIEILTENDECLTLAIPTYRVDVTRPADVVEEILRIYGYNSIGIPQQMRIPTNNTKGDENHLLRNKISALLTSSGFTEIMSNSMTKGGFYKKTGLFDDGLTVELLNPLSSELNVMRRSLLAGGLDAVSRNINRQNNDLRLFEFGTVYSQAANCKDKASDAALAYTEERRLALLLCGRRHPESWNTSDAENDFFHLKGAVEKVLLKLGCTEYDTDNIVGSPGNIFEYGLQLSGKGQVVALLGPVAKSILDYFDLHGPLWYAEIHWDKLKALIMDEISFSALPKYPAVRRDLALMVDEGTEYKQLKTMALNKAKGLLESVNLFDHYRGKGIPQGKKSYALSYVFRDPSATLTDERVDALMEKLIEAYKNKIGAEVR